MSLPNPTRVRMALMAAGCTQADIANSVGVTPTVVSAVVHGRGRSAKVENRIASVTGLPLAELWPAWHGKDAQRRHRPRMSAHLVAEALRAFVG